MALTLNTGNLQLDIQDVIQIAMDAKSSYPTDWTNKVLVTAFLSKIVGDVTNLVYDASGVASGVAPVVAKAEEDINAKMLTLPSLPSAATLASIISVVETILSILAKLAPVL